VVVFFLSCIYFIGCNVYHTHTFREDGGGAVLFQAELSWRLDMSE